MKEISWTQFKTLEIQEITEGECLKVTFKREMVFYVVVKPEQVMKDRIEANCNLIDASRGF